LPEQPSDELGTIAEIEKRNVLRANNHFPLLNVKKEIARLKKHYESSTLSDRFYKLASKCITEIYGPLDPKDFNNLSGMRGFFASKQSVIRNLIKRTSDPTATIQQSS